MSYRISVLIARAEGLRAADSNGKSDPYVSYGRVAPNAVFNKTKVIEKTLDPVWNEVTTWMVDLRESDWTVAFDIYDKDVIGKDFLGHAEIDLKKELLKDKEKKKERDIVLELGPGPKTSEKTAKKVTGKLRITVLYPSQLLVDDLEALSKLENQAEVTISNPLIEKFHEVSGGSDTIYDKAKMALLAADPKIFQFIVSLSANDDVTRSSNDSFRYTDEVIREIVTESDLVNYWSRVMLIITDCKKEETITVANYVARYGLVDRALDYMSEYQSSPDRDKLVFELMDFDGDGAISFDDLMAFQAFVPFAVQHKMEVEFLKDPKVAAMKQKISKFQYGLVIHDMFKKFNFPAVLRMMVIGLVVKATEETYNLVDVKYTPEQYLGFIKNEARRKDARASASRDLTKMIKDHSRDVQIVLQKALQKHGIN